MLCLVWYAQELRVQLTDLKQQLDQERAQQFEEQLETRVSGSAGRQGVNMGCSHPHVALGRGVYGMSIAMRLALQYAQLTHCGDLHTWLKCIHMAVVGLYIETKGMLVIAIIRNHPTAPLPFLAQVHLASLQRVAQQLAAKVTEYEAIIPKLH